MARSGVNLGYHTQVAQEDAMPHPMIVQDVRFVQYVQAFSAVFSLPQWKYFVTVLLGLLHCDERRTLSALLRHIAVRVTIFGLCHFLRSAPWSVDALTAVRQAYFYAKRIGRDCWTGSLSRSRLAQPAMSCVRLCSRLCDCKICKTTDNG